MSELDDILQDIPIEDSEPEVKSIIDEIVEDMTAELTIVDEDFNADILAIKVKNAYREVKKERNYPTSYTDEMIETDMQDYYSQIREIALYDYNLIGAEFQINHNENGNSMSFIDRNKLFSGIIPIAR